MGNSNIYEFDYKIKEVPDHNDLNVFNIQNHKLKNDENDKFYIICILPQFLKIQV